MTLRKRLFCNAKQPLLPCKTAAFGMQNNRFYNALIMKVLHNRYAYEKYLQTYNLFPVYKNGLKKIMANRICYVLFAIFYLSGLFLTCFFVQI
ncbi:hypothetical protein CLI69_00700 [Prevotella intermedia]|nr:hypothetical protein CLI69_00700 [Prevotella intermedia]